MKAPNTLKRIHKIYFLIFFCVSSGLISSLAQAVWDKKPTSQNEADLNCAKSVLGNSLPKLSDIDAEVLLEMIFKALSAESPFNVLGLSEVYLREVVAHHGTPYGNLLKSKFAEKALTDWPELSALGVEYSYQLHGLAEPLVPYEWKKAQLRLLSPEELTHERIKKVEAQILEVRNRMFHHARGAQTQLLDRMKVLFGQIAAMHLVAFQTSNQELQKAIEALLPVAFRTARGLHYINYLNWELQSFESAGPVAHQALLADQDPDYKKDLLEILRLNYTPQEHMKLIQGLFLVPELSRERSIVPIMTSSYRFATAVYAIHHPNENLVTHFGSHPVMDRLFALGGHQATVEIDGDLIQGTILMVRDYNPNQEGDTPILELDTGRIDLTHVTSISADGQNIFNIKRDSPIKAGTFAQIDPTDLKLSEIYEKMKGYIVESYLIESVYLQLIARTTILGEPVPYNQISKHHEELQDYLIAQHPLPVKAPDDASELVAEYRRLVQLSSERVAGSMQLSDLVASILMVKRLSSLLQLDLPSQRKKTLALLAASLANNGNVRMWGLNGGGDVLMSRGTLGLSRQVDQRLTLNERNAMLVSSGTKDSQLYIEDVLADRIVAEIRSMQSFESTRKLDKRLQPSIRLLTGSDAGFEFF